MQSSLALTALLMGLVGGPHCVAMCGAACAGIGQAAGPRKDLGTALVPARPHSGLFLTWGAGRGVHAGLGLAHGAVRSAAPGVVHVACGRAGAGPGVAGAGAPAGVAGSGRPAGLAQRAGFGCWVGWWGTLGFGHAVGFTPCGLLYSALLVAALAGGPLAGAMVMALFALGTSVTMLAGPLAVAAFARRSAWRRAVGRAPGGCCLGSEFWLGLVDGAGA